MRTFEWSPRCERPSGLVIPVRVDPAGVTGPTRSAARRGRWRQVCAGRYVPADTDSTIVEQRIVEQASRLGRHGGVTAWAALRWRGAAYFDGLTAGGTRQLPIPLLIGSNLRPDPRAALSWEQFAPTEREVIDGLPCATIQRALFDEMHRTGSLRDAVVAMDMAAAAGLISTGLMSEYVAQRGPWTGIPLVRKALLLATDDSMSPQESRQRLVWLLDAGLDPPLCNPFVFSKSDGRLLGRPDLLDPVAGLIAEYDGADHLKKDRRRRDIRRENDFRDHGLEYVTTVRGDIGQRTMLARRFLAGRVRARFESPEDRAWTLIPPPWFSLPEPLDARLRRTGRAAELTHT